MLMDFHAEQLITKKKTAIDYLLAVLIIFITVVLWMLVLTFIGKLMTIAAILIFVIGWGGFKLLQTLNVEYEYELTNQYLDIDKIMSKASRKQIISIDFKKVTICDYVTAPEFKNTSGISKTYDLSGNPLADSRVFADFTDDNNNTIRVIIRPNEKIKEYLKKISPSAVKL